MSDRCPLGYLFKIALWPSFGIELSLWLLTCAVFILVLSLFRVSLSPLVFRAGCVEFDCIGS